MAISKLGRVTYDTLAGALAGARPDIAFVSTDPGVGAPCKSTWSERTRMMQQSYRLTSVDEKRVLRGGVANTDGSSVGNTSVGDVDTSAAGRRRGVAAAARTSTGAGTCA